MATTAQVDEALAMLRGARFILAQSIEAHNRAVLVADKAAADVVTTEAARAAALAAEEAAKDHAVEVLVEPEI